MVLHVTSTPRSGRAAMVVAGSVDRAALARLDSLLSRPCAA
ncbi:hypothetical protein [Pseudonocardia abyssalis]|nr:hypothetical protein [Pseudonocardia abyssalis]